MKEKETKKNPALKKKEDALGSLKGLGLKLYDQMEQGVFPSIKMPSRSIENISYSPELRQYILGQKPVCLNGLEHLD